MGGGLPAGQAGIVPGSVVLLAGEPGMGKSTLLTQLALKVGSTKSQIPNPKQFQISNFKFQKSLNTKHSTLNTILYVCGEESPGQVKLRVERLVSSNQQPATSKKKEVKKTGSWQLAAGNSFYLLPETNVESVVENATRQKPRAKLLVIDSIQTLWTERLSGMAGSVGQVRECANILLEFAKKNNISVFLIGHVTKEGSIAGPKILEHLVDTVLYLEGDKDYQFRILRAVKNRFGSVDEVGIFSMSDKGMEEVRNPGEIFIDSCQKPVASYQRSGACKVVTMQGVRPMVVEIQALVVPTQLPVPRRVASGIDPKRLQILCAVLQKKTNMSLYNKDIFLSVTGGLKLAEPAVDFGICLAIVSSYKNKVLPKKSVAFGEIGLLGEIRKVSFLEKRIKQAKALGYTTVIGPEQFSNLREAIKKLLA